MRSRIPKKQITLLGAVPLFAGCTQGELRAIAQLGTPVTVGAGTVLTQQGEPGREFFLVLDGDASCRVGKKEVKRFKAGRLLRGAGAPARRYPHCGRGRAHRHGPSRVRRTRVPLASHDHAGHRHQDAGQSGRAAHDRGLPADRLRPRRGQDVEGCRAASSSTARMRRSSLLICARPLASTAAATWSGTPGGRDTQSVSVASQPPPPRHRHRSRRHADAGGTGVSRWADREFLVGVAGPRHGGRDQRGLDHGDRPELDRMGDPGLRGVGEAEGVAGAQSEHAPRAAGITLGDPFHHAHIGVVLGQVGEVEAVAPHLDGRCGEGFHGHGGGRPIRSRRRRHGAMIRAASADRLATRAARSSPSLGSAPAAC